MLNIIEHVPPGFLDAAPGGLHQILRGPTLIHLEGRKPQPLFVSVLLHGNEFTGLKAVQDVIGKYAITGLPRAMSVFVGNVEAASSGLRRLDTQPDYNRVWPGASADVTATAPRESQMMAQVVEEMRLRNVFASIDVHNNTGLNPHYGCVNALRPEYLHLATLFSHTVVYFLRPLGVQSAAFANLCPAVTVECGKSDDPTASGHAAGFIDAVLHLDHFPQRAPASGDINLFHTVATVRVPEQQTFGFGDARSGLRLDEKLDHMNFRELEPGTRFGTVDAESHMPLIAVDEDGRDVTRDYFSVINSELLLTRRAMPSMLTLDERIIRQDCLCYLMERYALPA